MFRKGVVAWERRETSVPCEDYCFQGGKPRLERSCADRGDIFASSSVPRGWLWQPGWNIIELANTRLYCSRGIFVGNGSHGTDCFKRWV